MIFKGVRTIFLGKFIHNALLFSRVDRSVHEKSYIIIENIWASMQHTRSYQDSNQLAQLR